MNWIIEDGDHKGCGADKNYTIRRIGLRWIVAAGDRYGSGFPIIFEETFSMVAHARQHVENIETMRSVA